MATGSALYTAEKTSTKPARAMTHPLYQISKSNGRKQKIKQGEPFDPEELSRRLNAHILEQKLKSEKRRAAKAAKAAAEAAGQDDGVYHHVPKVAASAFERTTTQDTRRKPHKLAENAIKAQREVVVEESTAGTSLSVLQKTQVADRISMEKEVLRGRNQFQWDHDLEVAHEEDVERGLYEPPQRTFHSEFAHLKSRHTKGAARPLSMGDVVWEELEVPHPKKVIPPHHTSNDRTDWVQREDDAGKKKSRTSPLLKKMESSWILMSKRPKASSNRDEAVAGIADLDSPPEIKQGFKGSFLARFKRQSS